MILQFKDGSKLNVLDIFGGPRLIMGVMRDTLRIEVDPSTTSFGELKALFKNNPNTSTLYSYTDAVDDQNRPVIKKNEIGEGYEIFVSITDEERRITPPPGKMAPDQIEEVFVVTIAQMTYQEYQQTHPDVGEEITPEVKE